MVFCDRGRKAHAMCSATRIIRISRDGSNMTDVLRLMLYVVFQHSLIFYRTWADWDVKIMFFFGDFVANPYTVGQFEQIMPRGPRPKRIGWSELSDNQCCTALSSKIDCNVKSKIKRLRIHPTGQILTPIWISC